MSFLGFVTIPSLTRLLDYARVQMAAEALYGYDARTNPNLTPGALYSDPISDIQLTDGNGHASRFTAEDAAKFAAEWEVIEHKSNTSSGFSGTLLKNKNTKDYVLSIRSTEFIDDAARQLKGSETFSFLTH